MKYKTPKVLERKPVVAGFDMKIVVVIIICAVLCLFTIFTHFFIAMLITLIGGAYVYLQIKFPGKGELLKVITYQTAVKCIHVDQDIKKMLVKVPRVPHTTAAADLATTNIKSKKTTKKLGLDGWVTVLKEKFAWYGLNKKEQLLTNQESINN